jgi:ribonucleoside-diphosphate reductase beta chain
VKAVVPRKIITSSKESKDLNIFDSSDGSAFIRADIVKFPLLRQLWETSLGLFWTVKMIDFSNDSKGFVKLPPVAQRMFKLTNGYQTIMDSGVVSIYSKLASLTNNSEVALLYTNIGFMESIHADSYSSGLTQMFGSEATKVVDIVFDDEYVRHRLDSEIDFASEVDVNPSVENIYKAIVATYLLEHIKFPFSFFITFTINKSHNNAINGFNQLISRIAQDELDIHVPTNKFIIKHMIKTYKLDIEIIKEMADRVLAQEFEWNSYLLEEGNIPGYNKEIGEEFIKYQHNKALRDVGYNVEAIKPNSFVQWFNHYRNPNNKQVSQQEMKSTQYQKGVLQNDLHKLKTTYV